jgi:hypothetical protein
MKVKFRKHYEIIGVYYWNDHNRICIQVGMGKKINKMDTSLLVFVHLSILLAGLLMDLLLAHDSEINSSEDLCRLLYFYEIQQYYLTYPIFKLFSI